MGEGGASGICGMISTTKEGEKREENTTDLSTFKGRRKLHVVGEIGIAKRGLRFRNEKEREDRHFHRPLRKKSGGIYLVAALKRNQVVGRKKGGLGGGGGGGGGPKGKEQQQVKGTAIRGFGRALR